MPQDRANAYFSESAPSRPGGDTRVVRRRGDPRYAQRSVQALASHAPVYGGAVINDRSTLVSASDDGSPHSQRNDNPSSRSAQVDPLTSFRSGHNAPDPCQPATAPNLNPPPGVFTVPCRWGHCGISLDDDSAGGMKRHLHGFHKGDMKKGMPCECKWTAEDGTPCQKHYANEVTITRHIATVHLKSSAENCPHCGMHMSRKDALNRHIQASCRVANRPV